MPHQHGDTQGHIQGSGYIVLFIAYEPLHLFQVLNLPVYLLLLFIHHFHEPFRRAVLNVFLDFLQGHAQLLQRLDDLEHIHLPDKIVTVSVLLLQRR